MKKFLCTLLLVLLAFPCWSASQNWSRYVNARFGYSIEYPDIFPKNTESENSDGIWLESKDGKTRLTLSGGYNVLMQDGADMIGTRKLEEVIKGESGSEWFRLVRREGKLIIHEYGVVNDEVWASFTFAYPATKNFNSA